MAKPNIIVIMTDDQGYGDLSCMGGTDFRTPHLDRMAAQGIRFSSLYAGSPVCSPSRAALLTGRYPGFAGVRSILAGHRRASGLTAKTPTLAGALKPLGYPTGLVGKWHLGLAAGSRPMDNGFDHFFGFMAGCIDYYSHIFYWGMADGRTNPTHDLWENGREVYQNGRYFTDLVTENSVSYIRQHQDRPFFLYVAYNAPHYPMHAPQKYLDRFTHLPPDRRIMAAMIAAVDDGVGEIRAELERLGLLENTILYFQSDNGPSRESRNWLDGREDPYYGGTTGGFTGCKFSLFEGGIRVPGLLSWPGAIPQGLVIDDPVMSMDLFPTLLEAAGGEPEAYTLDGRSLLAQLTGRQPFGERSLYWELGGQLAMRRGRYKLVLRGQVAEGEPARSAVFLSDLLKDPGERHNLQEVESARCAAMQAELEAWYAGLEAYWQEHFASHIALA